MPITAETFEIEHFDKLARGIEVAKEAHAKLLDELDTSTARNDQLFEQCTELEEALAKSPTPHQWASLVEFVEDVFRGIRTARELRAYVKELSQ